MHKSNFRYWLALHPDVARPIGGVKQMHRLAEALARCGREATIIQESADFHPGWFSSHVETISLKSWVRRKDLSPDSDLVVLPETFVRAFDQYASTLPKVIFNQNGAYSFGKSSSNSWPDPSSVLRVYHSPKLLQVLCVSEHDERLLTKGFGLGSSLVSRLKNPIETGLFRAGHNKRRQIAYMPRKNGDDAAVVAALLKVQPWWAGWKLKPIHQCTQEEVALILQESLAFMAFGHPEGFGLPIAEALACGCAVLGYSGLGGRELMALGAEYGVALEVAYGDWQGFVDGLRALDRSYKKHPHELQQALLNCAEDVRRRYSSEAFQASVEQALAHCEERWSYVLG